MYKTPGAQIQVQKARPKLDSVPNSKLKDYDLYPLVTGEMGDQVLVDPEPEFLIRVKIPVG